MFKRRSSNHPTTPKLASVALPETFSPQLGNIAYTLDIQPAPAQAQSRLHRNSSSAGINRTHSQNRLSTSHTTGNFFSRFRSSPALSNGSTDTSSSQQSRMSSKSHSSSNHSPMYVGSYPTQQAPRYPSGGQPRQMLPMGYRAQSRQREGSDTSSEDDDDDGVYHKQILPNVVAIRDGKKLSKEDQMEWDEEERRIVDVARKHPNARITLVKSKARIEEEREREEEQQRRRQQREREARERDYNERARAKAKETEDMDDPFARRAAREARKAAEEEERRREREQREMEEGKKRAQRAWEESQRQQQRQAQQQQAQQQAVQEQQERQEQRERQERRDRRQSMSQQQQQQQQQPYPHQQQPQQQQQQQQPARMRTEFPHDVQGPHQPQPRARPVKSILKPAKGPTTPAPPMTFGGGPSPEPSEDMGVDVGGYDESGYASSHQPRTQAQMFARRNSIQAQPNYHSDSEGYRNLSRGHRAHTFSHGAPAPQHPVRANTYPLDPRSSTFAQPPPSYSQPPSSYPNQPPPSSYNRESSRSRSGSHSRSRSGSHSQIETDVDTDLEGLAYHNALLNKNHNRPGPGMPGHPNGNPNPNGRSRKTSFSGGLPPNLNGMSISVPPMAGYGPAPSQPQQQQQQPPASRYMKPYQKSPQPQWYWPRDAFSPESVHTAQSAAWDPPTLPWMLTDPSKRIVDAKHPPQPVVFFDIAFDPRMREFEVKCMRPGEPRPTPLTRDEETRIASDMVAPTMIIVNDAYPAWTVVVRAKKGNCRVCEVFRAIHDTYAVTLTPQEMAAISPSKMQGVMAAFRQRCEDGPGLPPVEMAKGLRRVDVLRSERYFRGLEYVAGVGLPLNLWKLQLEKITR